MNLARGIHQVVDFPLTKEHRIFSKSRTWFPSETAGLARCLCFLKELQSCRPHFQISEAVAGSFATL
jgi:hypothetical protein